MMMKIYLQPGKLWRCTAIFMFINVCLFVYYSQISLSAEPHWP